jgi:hypothetical protein
MNCKTGDQNEGEREALRREGCHVPRSASRVFPSEHVRPQTVRADDTVVGYSEQTLASVGPTAPMAASTAAIQLALKLQFDSRNVFIPFRPGTEGIQLNPLSATRSDASGAKRSDTRSATRPHLG